MFVEGLEVFIVCLHKITFCLIKGRSSCMVKGILFSLSCGSVFFI